MKVWRKCARSSGREGKNVTVAQARAAIRRLRAEGLIPPAEPLPKKTESRRKSPPKRNDRRPARLHQLSVRPRLSATPARIALRGVRLRIPCPFRPRIKDSGEVRVQKILRLIGEAPLGIHDISRVELDPSSQLPRFNMPLELGLFLGAKAYGSVAQQAKRALILDSDRSGHPRTRKLTTPPAQGSVIPSGSVIARRYRTYRRAITTLCKGLQLDPRRLTFTDDISLVTAWLDENPWTPSA